MSLQPLAQSSTSTSTVPSVYSNSTRSHLRDFLPFHKHATFHVKLVIHELQSVPLISGEFRIKWKFKDLQAVNSDGRPLGFGRALALKLEKRKNTHEGKGKQKANSDETSLDPDPEKNTVPDLSPHIPILDLPEPLDDSPSSPHQQRPKSSHSSSLSDPQSLLPQKESSGIEFNNAMRGYTPFLPLVNFKVVFGLEFNTAVQITVEKDTFALLPSPLKLTVLQRVIPGDLGAPLNPRLGHIELNLAEYANAGPVTRRYLLRRSKVNALLKMTLEVTHISGEKNYRAPPLRKEEIKANLVDFINNGKVPTPAVFSPFDEDPWLESILPEIFRVEDEEAGVEGSPEIPQISLPPVKSKKRWRAGRVSELKHLDPLPGPAIKPSPTRQLNPTEMLIESIFNPFPTSTDMLSPFTYYATYEPLPKLVKNDSSNSTSEGLGTDGTSRHSFESSRQISVSGSELGHDASSSTGAVSINGQSNGKPWWRRRIGQQSRPTTPLLS